MLNAVISYLPEGTSGDVLSYWYQKAGGPVFNDCMCVGVDAAKPVMAHRFLNYLLRPGRRAGELHRLRRLPAADHEDRRERAVRAADPAREPAQLRGHARGLRQRQRVPGADRGRPAALGPGLGRVPQRMKRRAWAFLALPGDGVARRVLPRRVLRDRRGRVREHHDVYEPVPHWNPLDWNVGYMLQALEDVAAGRAHVARVRAHAALRRASP